VVSAPDDAPRIAGRSRADRLWFWVFVGLEVVALVAFVSIGRFMWFARPDEWDFLADRSLSWSDLVGQHGGHWVTIPVITYRVLFRLFGLHSYLPYQLVSIGLHLAAAALLRVVMMRTGVRGVVATATAAAFLFFGPGAENILEAFQIAFVGGFVFGVVHLLLADHDGPLDRRDWFGLAAGFAALMFSAVGLVMAVVVGIAVLIRRGWRPALFHTAPLFAAYGTWAYFEGHVGGTTRWSVQVWVWRGIESSFDSLGSFRFLGWVLAAILVVGLLVAGRDVNRDALRRRGSVPAAFLCGAVVFLAATGVPRLQLGLRFVTTSRYLYVVVGMLVVPLAVAVDALVSRRRWIGYAALAVVVVGVPSNMTKARDVFLPSGYYSSFRLMALTVPRSDLAAEAPRSLHPDPNRARQLTVGWLLDALAAGRLPDPPVLTPMNRATNDLRLTLQELNSGDASRCPALTQPKDVTLPVGQSLAVRGVISVQLKAANGLPASEPLPFGRSFQAGSDDHTLVAVVRPVAVRIRPRSPDAAVC
jgi:hypothetical protein